MDGKGTPGRETVRPIWEGARPTIWHVHSEAVEQMAVDRVERVARAICAAMGTNPDWLVTTFDPPIELDDPEFEAKSKNFRSVPAWREAKYLMAAHAAIKAMRHEGE